MNAPNLDAPPPSPHGLSNLFGRILWALANSILFRPSPRPAHRFRILILRLFGAKIHSTAHPYPKAKVWAPWNLVMHEHSCLADDSDCYNVAQVTLGAHSIVSQYAYLCTATHDHEDPKFPLYSLPIRIGESAWVAARAYIGPGVDLGDGSIAGANACVYKSVPPWTIVGGNPAKRIGSRVIGKSKALTPSA